MTNKEIWEVKLETTLVAEEFLKIFLEELINFPLNRKLEFIIKLTSSSTFIFQAPYGIVLPELKELKV